MNCRSVLAGVLSLIIAEATAAPFPVSLNGGAARMANSEHKGGGIIGDIVGWAGGGKYQTWFGYLGTAHAAFTTFLASNHPLAVHPEPAGAGSSKWIVSPDRTMRLSWSDGENGLPVQYRLSFGTDPHMLAPVAATADRFFQVSGLQFLQTYYWQVEAFDTYGRSTVSAVFSFSIAPAVPHLYCAPNPFRAGVEPTTFIFSMNGPGSARLSVYRLPSADLVFSASLEALQEGVNTYTYDGKDVSGRTLYNGVYMAILDMRGTRGHENQKFKFLVAR